MRVSALLHCFAILDMITCTYDLSITQTLTLYLDWAIACARQGKPFMRKKHEMVTPFPPFMKKICDKNFWIGSPPPRPAWKLSENLPLVVHQVFP